MGGKFSKSKPEAEVNHGPINTLDKDVASVVGKNLSLQEKKELARTSRKFLQFFKSVLAEAEEVQPLLDAVVRGNPEELEKLLTAKPELLVYKGQVTDPDGTIFYDISPAQLLAFLWEDDMVRTIKPLVARLPEAKKKTLKQQYAELKSGGADLVKMGQDPMKLVAEDKFKEIMEFKATYSINNQPTELTFSLLENPDGILYYQDEAGKAHFYYANLETQTVEEVALPEEKQKTLIPLFAKMDVNSSRRSSNAEHQLIADTMQHQLQRKGILYERKGERYRDSHADFNLLLNAYRHCIRLYTEGKWDEGDKYSREGVGGAQRNVIWLLQRICEKDRPFYPLPDFKASPFRRGFDIFNYVTGRNESVFSGSRLLAGLGSEFGICKAEAWGGLPRPLWRGWSPHVDLVAVCRLVEDAKANVVEFTAELDLQDTDANLPRGPG